MIRRRGRTGVIIRPMLMLVCWVFGPAGAFAEEEAGQTQATRSAWQIEKCEVYETALSDILDHVGRDGVSPLFLARNTEFIESGCLADIDACPQTDKDVEIANGLTIATMNAGAASSFSPFRCRP